jgi:WD40 repeat protein
MKNTKKSYVFVVFLMLILGINACGPVTPISVTDTSASVPSTTHLPAIIPPVNPDLELISAENIDALEHVGMLGTGRVYGYALSPDKSKIAIYVHDKVKIYNTKTLDEELTIPTSKYLSQVGPHFDVWSIIRFAQNGRTLAFTDGFRITLWDISTNQQIDWFASLIPDWDVVDIEFSPDDQRLILTTLGGSWRCDGSDMNFALYDITGQILFDQYSCADYSRYYYKFVSDDKVYFSFSSIMTDKFPSRFYLVDTQTGKLLESSAYDFYADPSVTQQVLYDVSPDGKILAYALYGAEKPSTKLIDYSTGKTIEVLDGLVEFLAEEGNITWQPRNLAPVNSKAELLSGACGLVNVHPVDKYQELLVDGNKTLLLVTHFGKFAYLDLYDLGGCQTVKRVSYPVSESAIFSPDGRWLATSDGFTVYLWDIKGKKLHFSVFGEPFTSPKDIVQFNADGTRLIVSSFGRDYYNPYQPYRDYEIAVFDVEMGSLVKLIKPTNEFLYRIVPSPDKDMIMARDSDGLHFWNIETGQSLSTIPSGAYVFSLISGQIWVTPQSRTDNPSQVKILVYNYMTGEIVREFGFVDTLSVRGLYLNGDHTKLIAHLFLGQGKDNGDAISVFNIETGEQILSYHLPWGNYEMSSYGDFFVTNGTDGYIHLWNYDSAAPVDTLLIGHKNLKVQDNYDEFWDLGDFMDAKLFSDDILFADDNDGLRFWSVDSGELLTEVKPDYKVSGLQFSPDKSIMVAIGSDGIIRLWGIPKKSNIQSNQLP